ncbi:MAG: polymer-forming cytoskeletal protein [Pseudomonadales bacterium]|jgi:cytoskeletal protein CcmA (bactofilin family)|nr:polymer-forming cytoskeletal protein [Pseudomonadales bacterium]
MFGDKDKDRGEKKEPVKPREREAAVPGKGATLIAANTRIHGDVHFADQLLVNGEVHGNVFADSDSEAGLTVSAKGSVIGEIRVPNVVINGLVKGDVYATRHVELAAEARVEGNVYYHLIEMVMGARVDGSLVYTPEGGQAQGKSRPSVSIAPAASEPAPASNPTPAVGKAQG